MNPQERLEKVKAIALKCGNCQLCEIRKKVVFGEGNPNARYMLIGEGPGRDEDLSGRPFVGRSGKLLRKMLQAIGLDPVEDCYIANIVKCRPPNNRTPADEEIENCVKFLKKQIEIINPEILILLGKTAVRGLLPEYAGEPVGKLREKSKRLGELKYNDKAVIVTYHPSAVLQRPQYRAGAKEDFRYLEGFVGEINEVLEMNSLF